MGLFSRGYEESRAENARIEKQRETFGKRLGRLFLTRDGDEIEGLMFLNAEPISAWEHAIPSFKNGKQTFERVLCPCGNPSGNANRSACPHCMSGAKPSQVGAFLVIDPRPYSYTSKSSGKEVHGKGQIRLYVPGVKVLNQLDRLNSKYRLTDYQWTMCRFGSGTQTSYSFQREGKASYTLNEVIQLLPEALREGFKLDEGYVLDFIEKQMMMWLPEGVAVSDDEDEPSERETASSMESRSKIINASEDADSGVSSPRPSLRGRGLLKNRRNP